MGWSLDVFAASVAAGIGATVLMDLFAVARVRFTGQPGMNWALVGRWVAHVVRGRWVQQHPVKALPVPGEGVLGWLFHYASGIALALGLTALAGPDWLSAPRPVWVVLYGMATVIVPMCSLQPGMGMGFAARLTPQPWLARRRSLTTHFVFGVGLYISARVLAAIQGG
ncbi:MAG: DUF2938 domain-containing protein [Rhodobacteraceae bacterium]|nr:DUF2938 domain-containing protein [Paracoccaceae bacterium]